MGFDKFFDGWCPECLLLDTPQELWLNKGDVFECPRCQLMISLASSFRATILRRRGQGNFVSLADRNYCAAKHARGLILVRENPNELYEADGYHTIETIDELRNYLIEITEVDNKL